MPVPPVQSRWRFTYPFPTRNFPFFNQSVTSTSDNSSQSENAQSHSDESEVSNNSSNHSEATINQSMPYDPPPYSP